MKTSILALLMTLAMPLAAGAAANPAKAPAAADVAAVDGILAAFEEADIVTLGERPWSKLDADFRIQLVTDPRFAERVDDIVVEFANARHQATLDAYVLDNALISRDSLSRVWQDGAEPGAWDSPVYAYFIETIRRMNQILPREQRVRILAGEPPYDWSAIRSREDLVAYGSPGTHVLDIVSREVLAKGRKALMIYSARNFFRSDRGLGSRRNLTLALEATHPTRRVFVVGTVPEHSPAAAALDSIVPGPERPVLVRLDRSKAGTWPARRIYEFADGSLGGMADALLYFGGMDDRRERPDASVTRNPAYVQEVARRKGLLSQ